MSTARADIKFEARHRRRISVPVDAKLGRGGVECAAVDVGRDMHLTIYLIDKYLEP